MSYPPGRQELEDRATAGLEAYRERCRLQHEIIAHTRKAVDHFEEVARKLEPSVVARRISLLLLGDTP